MAQQHFGILRITVEYGAHQFACVDGKSETVSDKEAQVCGSRSRKSHPRLQKRSSGAEAAQPEEPRPTNRAGTMDPWLLPPVN